MNFRIARFAVAKQLCANGMVSYNACVAPDAGHVVLLNRCLQKPSKHGIAVCIMLIVPTSHGKTALPARLIALMTAKSAGQKGNVHEQNTR